MNEVILTLILVSQTGLTTMTVDLPEGADVDRCVIEGDARVNTWIEGATGTRYLVNGYFCDTSEEVVSTILPFNSDR